MMSSDVVRVVRHADMSSEDLMEVVRIKSKAWNYPVEKQLEWMGLNLSPADIHFLVYNNNNELVSYANLLHIEAVVNGEKTKLVGVGNVCAQYRGNGDGLRLMNHINAFIDKQGVPGMLLCKAALVKFYERSMWQVVPSSLIDCSSIDSLVTVMVYNYNGTLDSFFYSDRLF